MARRKKKEPDEEEVRLLETSQISDLQKVIITDQVKLTVEEEQGYEKVKDDHLLEQTHVLSKSSHTGCSSAQVPYSSISPSASEEKKNE